MELIFHQLQKKEETPWKKKKNAGRSAGVAND